MKPPFHEIVDFLYKLHHDALPESMQDVDMGLAFTFGYAYTAGAMKLGYRLLDNFVSRDSGFYKKALPAIERGAKIIPPSIAFASLFTPGAEEFVQNFPVYTSGFGGVYAGMVTAIKSEEIQRSKLENLVN